MTNPPSAREPKNKPHYLLVSLSAIGGLIVGGSAYLVFRLLPDLRAEDVAVTQSILANLGIGFFSAAVLFLLEPKFRRAVRDDVTVTVTDTVRTATAGIADEVREEVRADFDEKLASLTERINSAYETKLSEQEAALKGLAADFSHESVINSFRQASDVAALFRDSLRVQGEESPGELHLSFELRVPNDLLRELQLYGQDATDEDRQLYISAYPSEEQLATTVIWNPEEDFAVVAKKIAAGLSRTRGRGLGQPINWVPIFSRLENGIRKAVDSSNRSPGAFLMQGALVEVAGSDSAPWYLTDDGIYRPDKNFYIERKQIVTPRLKGPEREPKVETLVMPDWADIEEWNYMIKRAKNRFRDFFYE